MARTFIRRPMDDPAVTMSSHMCVYNNNNDDDDNGDNNSDNNYDLRALSMDWFIRSARDYRLSGESTRSLCEHNAGIASALGRTQVY